MNREPRRQFVPELSSEEQAQLLVSERHIEVYRAIQQETGKEQHTREARQARLETVAPPLLRYAGNLFDPHSSEDFLHGSLGNFSIDEATWWVGRDMQEITYPLYGHPLCVNNLFDTLGTARTNMERTGMINTQEYEDATTMYKNIPFICFVKLNLLRRATAADNSDHSHYFFTHLRHYIGQLIRRRPLFVILL